MFEHTVIDPIVDERLATGLGGRWYGVYPAIVTDIKDPDGQGRVKVTLPWSVDPGGARYDAWARLATLMAGKNRGSWFIPETNDEVLIAFEGGDTRRPYVVGALWNGSDPPPASMDSSGRNDKKVLRSRNGVKVTLDDSSGREQFIAETPGGQRITLRDGPGAVEIVDSNGNSIRLGSSGIDVKATANVTVTANVVEVTASMVRVNAGMSRFSGIVQAETVITNSVISASYTPGAGNIW
jgi:uncharacterized protein involved in type VI secretion and phage assembly